MYRIRKLFLFDSPTYIDWAIYFTAFIMLQVPAIINFYYNDGYHNAYTQLAQSLLNGHFDLPQTTNNGDLSVFDGKLYLPYPPLPSFILAPFVLIFGAAHVNTVAIATIMSCVSLYLLHNIFVRLRIDKEHIIWLILAVFFGSGFWFALFTTHHVYAFAHITSFMFQLFVINEILGRRRWWLIGVFVGCTFLSRQFTLFYALFVLGYMFYLYRNASLGVAWKAVLSFFAAVGSFVALYLVYNYVRFGNPFDAGYRYVVYVGVLKERVQQYGIFSARYIPYNLYCALIKGFNIQFTGSGNLKIKDMDLWGTSLFSASPFLIASFKANWPKIVKIATWVTISLIFVGQLFYHNNGFEQVNTSRFTLDFLPLLIVLTALGASKLPMWLMKTLITYAVVLNVISFIVHLIYQ
jgi:hypothetical protein